MPVCPQPAAGLKRAPERPPASARSSAACSVAGCLPPAVRGLALRRALLRNAFHMLRARPALPGLQAPRCPCHYTSSRQPGNCPQSMFSRLTLSCVPPSPSSFAHLMDQQPHPHRCPHLPLPSRKDPGDTRAPRGKPAAGTHPRSR